MKKTLLLLAAASTLIITGCSWTKKSTDDAMMKKTDTTNQESMQKDTAMMDKDHMMMGTGMSGEWTREEMEKMKHDDMMKDQESMKKDDAMMDKDHMMKDSSYQDYDAAKVTAALKAGQHVALFFHAARCPSCRGLDADIKAGLSKLPTNSTIFKVDYDTMTDLKKQYGVTSQHTVVVINTDMSLKSKTIGGSFDEVVTQLK